MTAYPKQLEISGVGGIEVRPMTEDDKDALLDFFLHVPEEDRFFLKEDVTSPKVIREWAQNLNYSRTLPLLAFDKRKIIADATLHRRRAGSRKHSGEIRVVVAPEYRNKGIGTALIRELVEIAQDSELESLVFELVAEEQAAAIRTAEDLGFVRLASLPNFVRDIHGKPHDLIVMELSLGKWQEWWEIQEF
jgi:RimJ/RimL family protein N-acetyltransferase